MMARQIEPTRSAKPSLVKRGLAGVVVVVILALAVHLVIGIITTILVLVAIVAVAVAALWAAKTLL
jgi:uncharacterized membrane protein YccC